jgi:chromosome segregation ATPase
VKRLLKRLLGDPAAPATAKPHDDERKVDWKARAAEAIARVKTLEAEARQQAKRIEKFKAAAGKLQQRDAEIDKLRERLVTAERDLTVAREHLMAVEVKLDILEGAANVLDARTRSAIRSQPRETGAPV